MSFRVAKRRGISLWILNSKTLSPQRSQRSARRQEGQKFVRREMKRQRPVCHSESRSDEESRSGTLIAKTLSPQGTQRVGPRRENLRSICGLKPVTSHAFALTACLLAPRPCLSRFCCHPEERSDDEVPGVLCQGKDLGLNFLVTSHKVPH